jgi:hypothetical protein
MQTPLREKVNDCGLLSKGSEEKSEMQTAAHLVKRGHKKYAFLVYKLHKENGLSVTLEPSARNREYKDSPTWNSPPVIVNGKMHPNRD